MNKKSIWAVVAGVLFIVVVTTIVDVVLAIPQCWARGKIYELQAAGR